jgi:hypothetical protein
VKAHHFGTGAESRDRHEIQYVHKEHFEPSRTVSEVHLLLLARREERDRACIVRKAVLTHAHPPALCHAIQDEQHGPALGSSIIRRDKHIALIATPQAILPSKRKRQDGTLSEGELGRLGHPRVRGMDRLGVILKHWGRCRRSLPVELAKRAITMCWRYLFILQ